MTIICLSFKKRNKTLNVKKKTYDEDKKRIIRDEWQRKLEREHSRCQQMLKTNRYWKHIRTRLDKKGLKIKDTRTKSRMSFESLNEKNWWWVMKIDNELNCWKKLYWVRCKWMISQRRILERWPKLKRNSTLKIYETTKNGNLHNSTPWSQESKMLILLDQNH